LFFWVVSCTQAFALALSHALELKVGSLLSKPAMVLAEWLAQPVKNPVVTNTIKAKENFI
jgi:hypothetical protein